MEQPIGFFWHARRSQIYPELARLEQDGLVGYTRVEQQDRPDKKVYHITPSGLDALHRWAVEPATAQPDRDVFMLKVYSMWLASPEEAMLVIRASHAHHAERLARYEAIREQMERDWPPSTRRFDSPKFAAFATLQRGIEYERGYVAWCQWMAETLGQEGRQVQQGQLPQDEGHE